MQARRLHHKRSRRAISRSASSSLRPAWCRFPSHGQAFGCGVSHFPSRPRRRRRQAAIAQPPPAACHDARSRGRLCHRLGHTRIKPPGDVIKLADRLHYVLQPSLESLLAEGSLAFPVQPFPFQFEGVAFLYPRQAAILADEMGLGKTMQAITALRLLLRRGEMQSVLLVCPKPLVTNWQREFALWAPELPLMVDRRRSGQAAVAVVASRTCPCDIANYEFLLRDRELLRRPAISIWWCSTSRSGSRTGPVPPAKWSARFPAAAAGP